MIHTLPYKTKQFFFVLIKLSIVVTAFYFIYQKTIKNPNLDFLPFREFLIKNDIFSLKTSCFLLLLSVFNWFFEILKWQNLVSPIKRIRFKSAMEQSLGSLTASLMTPNRIGEYGAKAMYYKKEHRKRIVLINLIGNMTQMAATCVFGIVGLSFFTLNNPTVMLPFKPIIITILAIGILALVLCLILKKRIRIHGYTLQKLTHFIIDFLRNRVYLTMLYSCLRYLLFSFQFYYLLTVFQVDITYLNAMATITTMYFLASIIPSIFIFDAIIKGSIALYLFSFLGISELVVLSIVMIMWLLNFVLPSMFGSFYVLNYKLPNETE